ncbi:Predicted ATPase [Saccharopolyspora shandongensis]|uniref:Predicted ATPase n=1 Tax=Saccharopolyspora shandongensis TaxID=418495 RepID=A0A1H3RJB4_9PSEU|nr:Predicted ATPase [Saccharopolyspora shandongensis]
MPVGGSGLGAGSATLAELINNLGGLVTVGDGVHNESAAQIGGHSVQAGQIHGDVHFHNALEERLVPRQLPVAARHFVNRAVEQDALTTLLGGATSNGFVLISTVDGVAGVGKSTLAVHWAHRMRDRFPDGELYVNLRGFDSVAEPVESTDALGSFLIALGVPTERMPQGLEARAGLFRSLVHGKQMLVLLDNARTAEQVRPLLPGSPSCLVLVTSRNRLHELVVREGATRVSLDVLTADEAELMLASYLGDQRVAAEQEAVRDLIRHCAGLPLALGIAAARAVENPDFPLTEVVSQLQDERDRLDALDAGGVTGLRSVFSWPYRSLTPEAARLFRLLGLPTGPDIGLRAAADLAGRSRRETRALLAELSQASLLDQHEPGRYRFHDLLRAYAAERAATDEAAPDRDAAIRRLLDHYLRTSHSIDRFLVGHSRKFALVLPPSEVVGSTFDDEDRMLDWWDDEYANLTACIGQAHRRGFRAHAWSLAFTMFYFFRLRGYLAEWIRNFEMALGAVRELGDRRAEAQLLHGLAVAYFEAKQHEKVVYYSGLARELFEQADDRYDAAMSLLIGSESSSRLDRHDVALEMAQRGLELQVGVGDPNGRGYGHGCLGVAYMGLREYEKACSHFNDALTLYREVGEVYGESYILNELGELHLASGEPSTAVIMHREALRIRREIGYRRGEGQSFRGLGNALFAAGDREQGRANWEQALTIFEELGDVEADSVRQELGLC